jgi:hypothetical protein
MKEMFTDCIDTCEKLIDACQKLVDLCSASDDTDCAKQVGITAAACANCEQNCKDMIKHVRKLLEKNNDNEFVKQANWTMKKCETLINICRETREKCKAGDVECINKCLATIEEAQKCAEACNNISKMM